MKPPRSWTICTERLKLGGQFPGFSLPIILQACLMTVKFPSLSFKPVRGAPPGLLGALKFFKYVEAGKREEGDCVLSLPVVAQKKPSFLRKTARQGSSFHPELEVRAWLRVPVGRLKSGGESPPFLTRSRVSVICACGYTPGHPLSSF